MVEKNPVLSDISPIQTSPEKNRQRSVMEISLTYAEMAKSPPKIQRKIPVMTSKVKAPSAPKKSPGKGYSPRRKSPGTGGQQSPGNLVIDESANVDLGNSSDIPKTPKTSSPVLKSKNGSPLISINDRKSIFYDIGNPVGSPTELPYHPPQAMKSFDYLTEARDKILNKAKQRKNSESRVKPYCSSPARDSGKLTPGRTTKL